MARKKYDQFLKSALSHAAVARIKNIVGLKFYGDMATLLPSKMDYGILQQSFIGVEVKDLLACDQNLNFRFDVRL